MSSNDSYHYYHQHGKTTQNVFDKLSNKFSAIKEDITEAVKERSRSFSSDRHSSMSSTSTSSLMSTNSIAFSSHDDAQSMINHTQDKSLKTSGNSGSLTSLGSSQFRHTFDQLLLNKGSIRSRSNISISSNSTIPSLIITSTNSQIEDISTPTNDSKDSIGNVKERIITKIDPVEMTAKDTIKRSPMLLSGPKFQLHSKEIQKNISYFNNDQIFSISIFVGVISLIVTLWKPISSFVSGLIVGSLFALVVVYIFIRMFIHNQLEKPVLEEWIDFPSLDSMLTKIDKEDKQTNIQVTGASMSFQSYDADRDDDFVRYPCDIRLDGYRLIIQLASKPWSEEKRTDKEIKFIGCREYFVKESRMILVPEATLTRSKYWMNEYPIVIHDLQILDKQIYNKQQFEKSKIYTNDFFLNTATTISIWFETCPQKEEWFHKLSLVLRRGREDIKRSNHLFTTRLSSSFNRRQIQTDDDTELISQSIVETQLNLEELQKKFDSKKTVLNDASETQRTVASQSRKLTINEINLQKVLQTPECLDETAITMNFLTRRLLCDMFDIPLFKDFFQTKIELKLKEIAVSIFENFRVVSLDLGNTFPIILKVERMQWNTQGIWINLFLYYRGNFKFSVKTRVVLQKLINYDPKKDKPIFAQHHSAQLVHKDDERIDENDLIQRQKLLAKEPEIAEMAVTRKFGTALTNLALNKYFQFFANLPFIKKLFEKFSEKEVGVDVEVTSFSGILTLNIPPPPSDRIWVGCPEMPDLNIKIIPTYGENQYSYKLLQDFLSAKIRTELKRLIVLPAMDDQLLPFFRDWAIDVIGEIVSKPINPHSDDFKSKLNIHEKLQRQSSKTSIYSEINSIRT